MLQSGPDMTGYASPQFLGVPETQKITIWDPICYVSIKKMFRKFK